MLYKQIVVVTTYHLGTDDFWDVWETLILKHSLNIFSSVPHPLCLRFPGKIVLFLQFLQVESHSTNASSIGAFVSQFESEIVSELMQLREDIGSAYEDLVERWQVWFRKY